MRFKNIKRLRKISKPIRTFRLVLPLKISAIEKKENAQNKYESTNLLLQTNSLPAIGTLISL